MSRFNRVLPRVGLPIAIGLVLIAFALAALTAPGAQASQVDIPIARPKIDSALAPNLPLTIPPGTPPTKIDGQCPSSQAGTEWGDALALPYSDVHGVPGVPDITGTVLLKHDNNYLYVCLQVATAGQPSSARFASVYLDTLDTRSAFAGPTDYGLRVDIVTGTSSINSVKGTGVPGGYVPTTLNGWTAATVAGAVAPFDGAEYQIPLALTGGACGQSFGLAVYHHWVFGDGNSDYGWPSNQYYDQPQTWTEVQLAGLNNCTNNSDIAYIYKYDLAKANDFKALLTSVGYGVDLIPMSAVTTTNFTTYTELIVADDTGSLDQWGSGGLGQITPITIANKPLLGLGEGGYAFFGQLGSPIGWPHGWHGPQQFVANPVPTPANYYVDPFDLSGLLGSPIKLYQALVNEVAIYVPGAPPPNGTVLGWELPSNPQGSPDHAPLMSDACRQLWGFSESPTRMTVEGQRLFLNAVKYGYTILKRYCDQTPPPPPPDCVTLVKTAVPPTGSAVHPGDAIAYTLAYTVANNAQCATVRSLLIDKVPDFSLFIPGSATGGITPNFANTLVWDLGPLTPGTTGSTSFKVSVLDTACRPGVVTNTAKLQTNLGTFTSNTTTHKLICPPVVPPNNDPPYAESEIQIYPYPLVTGSPTQVSVRVFNNSVTTQTVTVTFQTSPDRFGIGIPFGTLPVPGNPRVLTIGGGSYAEVVLNWTPVSSGHYCMLVKIESAGYDPIYTYRNLDVTEDLKPGVTDVLTFAVANPTSVPATITLVGINTCPGWTLVITPSSIIANPGIEYTSTLRVTPPNPATLGTGCHIDVQGWIGDQLIGGIRKLDVPPVNLPHADPSWLEKEISTIPTPPISGTVNQACIELQNPLGFSRQVTVTFSEAAFGAGIGFTPFKTQVFTLPPSSLQKYCVNWTPMPVAGLHRCLLVELDQAGWQRQRSQRNVDLVQRPPGFNPGNVHIPFSIGNPFPFTSKLNINGILIGLNNWMPKFLPDPPPDLAPGEMWNGELMLVPAVQQNAPQNAPQADDFTISGDVMRVDVEVLLNDQPASGFSVDFAFAKLYLPLIMK